MGIPDVTAPELSEGAIRPGSGSTPSGSPLEDERLTPPVSDAGGASPPAGDPRGSAGRRELFGVPLGVHAMPALDGLRALAASLVFLVHFQAAFGPLLGAPGSRLFATGEYMAAVGYHGVTVFFVLSGYLIYQSLFGRSLSLPRYFRRRLRRIYPPFLAMLVLYLCLAVIFDNRAKFPPTGVATFVLQNALLLPGVFAITPIITVAWSLSYEVCYYIAIALLVAGLRMRGWTGAMRTALMLVICAALLFAPGVPTRVRGFALFIPGILVYEAHRRADGPRPRRLPAWLVPAWFALALCVAPLVAAQIAEHGSTFGDLGMSALTILWLSAGIVPLLNEVTVAGPESPVVSRMSSTWPRTIGVVSYSFYLVHGLTINAVAFVLRPVLETQHVIPGPLLYFALLAPVYVACFFSALLLFKTVERRFSL
jgi:peptidoglycan/LPS O-acetylase OafA/YrhL